jgi:RimK family alpha-L-glutamate ligase
MNKKIITFTMSLKQSQFEVERLATEAEKLGVEINRALYRELSFDLKDGRPRVLVRGEEVTAENTMGVWFRVAGTISGKYTEGRNLLISILGKKIFCANHEGYLKWSRMGKISQHGVFLENDILVIPTKIFYTKEQVLEAFKSCHHFSSSGESAEQAQCRVEKDGCDWNAWPVIAKHEKGYQGKSVKRFNNFEELTKFVNKINEKNVGMFLWQKYLPTRWDIRVIVLDGEAIGGMKRSAVGEEFRSNFSLGGAVEKWELSEGDKLLAEKVAKVCGLDYCGVDIMKDEKGNSYILEVNRQCQFMGFEKSTGINVAKKVVEMFLKKGI